MALYKEIVKPNGVTTTYHKVTSVTVSQEPHVHSDVENGLLLSVKLTSYLNKEYRDNNQPIESQMYYFDITSEEEEATSARRLGYAKIKETEAWADAEDC